jgi:hypothetical protein
MIDSQDTENHQQHPHSERTEVCHEQDSVLLGDELWDVDGGVASQEHHRHAAIAQGHFHFFQAFDHEAELSGSCIEKLGD